MNTNAALDKVAKGIETAQPKIEDAVRKTLGEGAAQKVHDVIEKVEHALDDIGDAANKAAAQVKPMMDKLGGGAGGPKLT